MIFHDYIIQTKTERNWKNNSRIIGLSGENYFLNEIICPKCKNLNWKSCNTNQKSKDFICSICNQCYQIKCKKISDKKYNKIIDLNEMKIQGADYNTTISSIEQNENIDYVIILYDEKYEIKDLLHVDSKVIKKEDIIAREPLKLSAKRKGWQGCMIRLSNLKSILLQQKLRKDKEQKYINIEDI
jgi:type II restriction enzyme